MHIISNFRLTADMRNKEGRYVLPYHLYIAKEGWGV